MATALMPRRRPDGSPVAVTAAVQPVATPGQRRRVHTRATTRQSWQREAIAFDRDIGLANFANAVVSNTIGRCIALIERYDPATNTWEPTDDPSVNSLLAEYRNDWEGPNDLRRMHAWCYQVPGEGYSLVEDRDEAMQWFVYQPDAVDITGQGARVRDLPADRGRLVPPENLRRFWLPSPEWRALATSPMRSLLSDLRRYKALTRFGLSVAESGFVMAGMTWFPSEMLDAYGTADGAPAQLIDDYVDNAMEAFNNEDAAARAVPLPTWGPKDAGKPEYVEVGRALDSELNAATEAAAKDVGRGSNLPGAFVTGGGVAETQHWGQWLVHDQMFASAVAPVADRIHHHDITALYLRPMLLLAGMPQREADLWRIGYDSTPVIVKEDKSNMALRAWSQRLISGKAARDAIGMGEDDGPTEDDLRNLGPRPGADPGTGGEMDRGDDTREAPEPNAAAPVAAAAGGALRDVSKRVAREHHRLIERLHGAAEVALRDAMRRAGVKVASRARRKNAQAKQAAARAQESGVWSRSVLAQVGVDEAELLDHAFDGYADSARAWLDRYCATRNRGYAEALGVEEPPCDPERREAAVGMLTASLVAIARQRLHGDPRDPALEAAVGPVPVHVAAGALDVLEGRATVTLGENADAVPQMTWTDTHDWGDTFDELGVREIVVWTTGAPENPFEEHQELDGIEVVNPVFDGATGAVLDDKLVNTGSFPAGSYYHPGDHEGCQCMWDYEYDL